MGFISVQNKYLRVYTNDFKVSNVSLEYYQVIPDLDIEGYIHLDGSLSTNKPIPLSEQYVDQIINLAAEEFEKISKPTRFTIKQKIEQVLKNN